jgi:hypothetical protein
VRALALEPDAIEVDASGSPVNVKFDYETLYFWAGHHVHATIQSLGGHEFDTHERFKVHSRKKAERELGPIALFNVLAFTCKTFICGLRFLKLDQPRAMNRMWKMMEKF